MAKGPLKIKSDYFEITIHRDKGLLSFQSSVFIGLALMYFLSDKDSVHTFCIVLGLIDIISFIIVVLGNIRVGDDVNSTDEESSPPKPDQKPETMDVKVDHKQSESSVQQTESVIRNKVPPVVETKPPEVSETSEPPPLSAEPPSGKYSEDVEYWNGLFSQGAEDDR